MGIYGSFRILPVSVRCLFPRAMSQADMLACPFGGAVCRWHTVSTDRNEVQTCREGAVCRWHTVSADRSGAKTKNLVVCRGVFDPRVLSKDFI